MPHNGDIFPRILPRGQTMYSGRSRISPRGAVDLVGGVWTHKAVMFRKFCMLK